MTGPAGGDTLDGILLTARYDTAELEASAADVARIARAVTADIELASRTGATLTFDTGPAVQGLAAAAQAVGRFTETGQNLEGVIDAIRASLGPFRQALGGFGEIQFLGNAAELLERDAGAFATGTVEASRYAEVIARVRAEQAGLQAARIVVPDFAAITEQVIVASDRIQAATLRAFNGARLGTEWSAEAHAGIQLLQTQLLEDLGALQQQVSAGLFPNPAVAEAAANALLSTFEATVARRVNEIPQLRLRVQSTSQTDAGVISAAELDASEAAWDAMAGAAAKGGAAVAGAGGAARTAQAELATLLTEIAAVTADFRAGARSADDWKAALASARQSALELRTAGRIVDPGDIQRFGQVIRQTAPAFDELDRRLQGSGRGALGAARSLGVMAAATVGVNGPVASLARNILLFEGGVGLVAGVAAGVLALGGAIEFVSGRQRELQTRQDDYVRSLLQEAQQAVPEAVQAAAKLAAARQAAADAQNLLPRPIQTFLEQGGAIATNPGEALLTEAIRRRAAAQQAAAHATAQAEEDVARAVRDNVIANVQAITQSIQLRQTDVGLLRQVPGLLQELQRIENDRGAGLVNQLAAIRARLALEQAEVAVVQQLAATEAQAVSNTAAAVAAQVATATERQAALISEQAVGRAARDTNTTMAERVRALQELNTLTDARIQREEQSLTLARQAAAQQVQNAQQARTDVGPVAGLTGIGAGVEALDALIARTERLRASVDPASEAFRRLTASVTELEGQRRTADRFSDAILRLHDLPSKLDYEVRLQFADPADALRDLLTGAQDAAVRHMLDQILAERQRVLQRPFLESGFQHVQTPVGTTVRADVGQIVPDPAAQAEAERFFQQMSDDLTGVNRKWANVTAEARRYLAALHDARSDTQRFADQMGQIAQGASAIAEAAANVGLIGQNAAQSIGQVLQLADAVAKVAASASTGNILALAATAVGVIGSIFGPSEQEREHDALLDRNNQLLAERNAQEANAAGGVAGLGANADILQQALAAEAALRAAQTAILTRQPGAGGLDTGATDLSALADLPNATEVFKQILGESGLTIREFAAEVKAATGIDILDEKGRLVADAFDQARGAIDDMVREATTFGASFDDQRRRLDLRAQLEGTAGDAAAAFGRELQALAGLSPAVAEAFKGVDVKNADQVRAAALNLFNKFDSGFFAAHPDLFGKIEEGDFLGFLQDAAQFVNGLGDAAKNASDRIGDFNLPEGFRRAALTFQAQAIIAPTPATQGQLTEGPGFIQPESLTPVTDSLAGVASRLDQLRADQAAGAGTAPVTDGLAGVVSAIVDLKTSWIEQAARLWAGQGGSAAPPPTAPPAEGTGLTVPTSLLVQREFGVRVPLPAPERAPADGGVTHVTVQVYLQGRPTSEFTGDVTEAVTAALRQIGMVQSGNTLQFGGR